MAHFVRRILAAAGCALVPLTTAAQLAPAASASLLPEVVVTATRVAEDLKDIPATITVIDAQQIDRGLVRAFRT